MNSKMLAALLGGVSAMSLASVAFAQDSQAVEEVVVTGSRVIQNGNNSPTPVTVVSTQELTSAVPSSIPDALKSLPVFMGATGQTGNPGNSGSNGATNTLNLRNIGGARTLVLFDGKRIPTSNIDTLPQMLMQRVDIVTGGASAVYGSDAVAGVVNFIIDRNFNGLKINSQYGISSRGDGETWRAGIAGGTTLMDGRLHVEGSIEHYHDPGIFSKLVRQIGRDVWTMQGAGTNANPFRLVKDTRLVQTSFYGKILTGPLADQVFKTNGVASPFVHGGPSGNATVESGGDGAYFYDASLKSMLINTQFFGRADYQVTDNVNFWVQGTYVDGHNKNNHQTNEFRNLTLSAQNAFLAPQYRAMYAAANITTFTFGKMMQQAPPLSSETFWDNHMLSAGLEGRIGDWRWEIAALTSKENQDTANNANMRADRRNAALDAVVNPANGQIVCNVTLTHPTLYPGCVPLNPFGPTSESPEAIAYILQKSSFVRKTGLDDISGSIAGSPFSTWAGPIQMAISGEWRKNTLDVQSTGQPTDLVNCTGLRFNCTATTTVWVSNVVSNANNLSQTVKEVAGEADVPLLRDVPLFQSFNVNGAARYTKYDTSGAVWTWKVGVDWGVNDDIKLRGTRSRDIMAPSVSQLFGPVSVNPAGINDSFHTGVSAQAPVQSQSNANLVPEVANTVTVGVVYRPSWLPSFSAAIDFYRIKIDNGIGNVSGNNATVARLCEDSNGTSPLCDLFIRPFPFSNRTPANFPTLILSQNLNIAEFFSKGIDFEVNYRTELAGGNFAFRGLMSYQPKQTSVTIPGTPEQNAAGAAGLPDKRVTLIARWNKGPFTIDVQERWRDSLKRSSDTAQVFQDGDIPAYAITNVSVSYDVQMLGGTNQFFVNVQNLFDKKPPPHGGTGGGSTVPGLFLGVNGGDDFIGTYFTMGFRLRR